MERRRGRTKPERGGELGVLSSLFVLLPPSLTRLLTWVKVRD